MSRRFRLLAAGTLVLAIAVVAFAVAWVTIPADPPGYHTVRAAWQPSESYLLDRHGALLQERRTDFTVRRLSWVGLDRVSPAVVRAVVGSEDRRFRRHGGVDFRAILAAAIGNLRGHRMRGASTITMQLAAMLDPTLTPSDGRRTIWHKIRQARAAWRIERGWTKDQILEAYLNLLGYRGELQGIAAAAQFLFGKAPSGLTDGEATVLAALLPAPSANARQLTARACALGKRMSPQVDCTLLAADVRRVVSRGDARPPAASLALHLAERLAGEPGQRVTTTLDAKIQSHVLEVLRTRLGRLAHRNVRDGAAIVVDNATGNVLAYVGSGGPHSRAPQVDGASAHRQAGSTLKPFLYGLALERRYLTAVSLLNDAPINLETATGLYIPQNYDRDYKGLVSVRTALGNSLNIPAVRTLVLVGVEPFRLRLNAVGYDGITEDGEYYGYALALGAPEVSLLEQVAAYRSLARGGLWSPLRFTSDEPRQPDRRVMSARAAFIISNILSDRAARTITFGLASDLETPFWSAVKTGTSKAMRDNWCIGFTDRYTVGVWAGNFEGDSMEGVSGVTGAAPVWRDIIVRLHAGVPSRAPDPPDGVVARTVEFEPAIETPRRDWFLAGTETSRVVEATAVDGPPRITSPPNGVVIALDPDIPPENQRLAITLGGAAKGLSLTLDGRPLDVGRDGLRWAPVPGYHELALLDSGNQAIDSIRFTVRAPW